MQTNKTTIAPNSWPVSAWCLRRNAPAPLLVIASLLTVSTCFGGKVQSYVGKDVDFSKSKTYQWLPIKVLTKTGIVENDDVAAPLIRDAVNRELALKGLREVEKGGDLEVSVLALNESIPQLEAVIMPAGAAALDYAQPIGTMGRYNKEGTLVVNLIITGTPRFAWLGIAKESISNKPGSGLKKIDNAATALFKKYGIASK
jgi:hypothetical protein